MAEVVLPSRKRIDGVIIDHANRTVKLIELKPTTDRAGELGLRQLREYAAEVAQLSELRSGSRIENIQGYQILTELRRYDINWNLPW